MYFSPLDFLSSGAAMIIGGILVFIAVIAGIALRFTVFSPKNQGRYTGFMEWLYRFMNFDTLVLEPIVKILFSISTCVILALALTALFTGHFFVMLWILVIGLVTTRVSYELIMMSILLVTNIIAIRKKLDHTSPPQMGANPPRPPYPPQSMPPRPQQPQTYMQRPPMPPQQYPQQPTPMPPQASRQPMPQQTPAQPFTQPNRMPPQMPQQPQQQTPVDLQKPTGNTENKP